MREQERLGSELEKEDCNRPCRRGSRLCSYIPNEVHETETLITRQFEIINQLKDVSKVYVKEQKRNEWKIE